MEFKYKAIKSDRDLMKFKDKWKKLEKGEDMTAFQSFEWNVLLVEQWLSFRYNRLLSDIYIAEVIDNSDTVMLIPLVVQKVSLGIKWLGRKKGVYFLGIESWSDYLNAVYSSCDDEMFDYAFEEILKAFPGLNISLNCVRDDTFLSRWCQKKGLYDNETKSVYVSLPESVEEYNNRLSKSTKQNLRTALNRMDKGGYRYDVSVCGNINDNEAINELCDIHARRVRVKNKRNKEKLDRIHYYSNMLRSRYVEWHDRKYDIVRNSMSRMTDSVLVMVRMNDDIVGYLYGLMDDRAIRIMQNCFKMEYAFYSPLFRGTYDFILEEISKGAHGVKEIDFTRGDESYKYKLNGKEMLLHNYVLVSD